MCLTKQEKIINFKDRMLTKLIDMNHDNWKKRKKYQYLYLQKKLILLCSHEELHDVGHGGFSPMFNRVSFYYNWLDKINKKYNYA